MEIEYGWQRGFDETRRMGKEQKGPSAIGSLANDIVGRTHDCAMVTRFNRTSNGLQIPKRFGGWDVRSLATQTKRLDYRRVATFGLFALRVLLAGGRMLRSWLLRLSD
jgi:hypothetical protein